MERGTAGGAHRGRAQRSPAERVAVNAGVAAGGLLTVCFGAVGLLFGWGDAIAFVLWGLALMLLGGIAAYGLRRQG